MVIPKLASSVAPSDNLRSEPALPGVYSDDPRTQASAVSWGAIVAGAAAAAALSLILLILGAGLGLSAVSPWAYNGMGATTFGVSTILWLTLTQLLASGMGGYLAGRLRSNWVGAQTDEIYFRDTAHGFLAWAVAALATAALLTSVIGSIVSGGIQAGAAMAGGAATTAMAVTPNRAAAPGAAEAAKSDNSGPLGYFVDSLFRKDMNVPGRASASPTNGAMAGGAAGQAAAASPSEVTRIFMNAIGTGNLPSEDRRYLGQLVAQRTGLKPQDAEQRVHDTFARLQATLGDAASAAKEMADQARKASAYAALWLFISLLGGAFVASMAAIYGGRQRDL
jgi:hypothetical protein